MMMMEEEEEVEEEKTEMGMIDRKVEVQIDSEVEMMLFRHPSIAVQMGNENDSLTIFLLPLGVFAVLLPFLTIAIAMGFLLLSSLTSRTSPTLPHCEHEL
jgi:hypothetical protein